MPRRTGYSQRIFDLFGCYRAGEPATEELDPLVQDVAQGSFHQERDVRGSAHWTSRAYSRVACVRVAVPNNKPKRHKLERIHAIILTLVEKLHRRPRSWRGTFLASGHVVESAMRLINDPEHYAHAKGSLDPRLIIDLVMDALEVSSDQLRPTLLRRFQDIIADMQLLPRRLELPPMNKRELLGTGGEVVVWVGRLRGANVVSREYGMPDEGWDSEEGRRVLRIIRREVTIRLQIHHPNIVPLLGISISHDHPLALISPYYQHGHSLRYLNTLNSIERTVAIIRISIAMASALCYLHSSNPPIIHGDIHPGNVVIDHRGEALLIDLGLARIKHERTRSQTDAGSGGSYRYIAPELTTSMMKGTEFRTSSASDCYAFAMTILSLLTNKAPFAECPNGLNAMKQAEAGVRPVRPGGELDGLPQDVSDRVWRLLEQMWAQNPEDRPSLNGVQMELRDILSLIDARDSG